MNAMGAPTHAAPTGFDAAWREVVSAHHAALAAGGVVGCGLMLVHGGRVAALDAYGLADRDAGRAVDADTIFHWASVTKTFTGVAVMQLRDRGLLSLDEPVVRYVPELRQVHSPFAPVEAVAVRHLMSHSAGFRAATWPWGGDRPWHPHEPKDWAALAATMPYTDVAFAPGSRYAYSNLGVVFLGRIVELLTGDDYEVYVDKNVLRPLGMYRSYFDDTPYHLLPHRANHYVARGGVLEAGGLDFDTGVTVSNGGLNAPLSDMKRYLDFLAGRHGEGVLARASLEEMWTPRHPVAERGPYRESAGLSFFVLEGRGRRFVGHTGAQRGFISFLYVDPATGAGAAVAYNTVGETVDGRHTEPDTRALSHALRERLFDLVFPLFG